MFTFEQFNKIFDELETKDKKFFNNKRLSWCEVRALTFIYCVRKFYLCKKDSNEWLNEVIKWQVYVRKRQTEDYISPSLKRHIEGSMARCVLYEI